MIRHTSFMANISLVFLIISTFLGNAIFNLSSTFFIFIFLYEIIKNKDYKFFNQTWLKLISIFFIIILFSSFFSDHKVNIFYKNLFFFRFFLIALCVQYCLSKYKNAQLFLNTIVFTTLFISIDALVQYYFGTNLFGNKTYSEDISRLRLTGIFGDEEIVGSYLIKFIFLGTIGTFLISKENKIITYLYFFIIAITILLSQERMTFILLSFSIFILLIFFLSQKKIFEFLLILLVSLLIVLFAYNFDKSLKARYLSIFTNSSGLAKVKLDNEKKLTNLVESIYDVTKVEISFKDSMWGAHYFTAIEIFKSNFIIGSGPRSFRYECSNKRYENLDIHYVNKRCSTHPHNYFLEILSEIGLLGFCYIVILLGIFYFKQFKFFLKNKNYAHVFGLLTIFVNLWPIASTGSIYATFNGLIIWITIGYILSFSEKLDIS